MDNAAWTQGTQEITAPSGTVTLLFTDIVGSTAQWEAHPAEMAQARLLHFEILKEEVVSHQGVLFKTVGDGGCAAFSTVPLAIRATHAFLSRLKRATWPPGISMQVRTAIHTGTVAWEDGDYVGRPVNRVARLCGLAEGGQMLLSATSADLADTLPHECEIVPFGCTTLKGFGIKEDIYQLSHPDLVVTHPRDELNNLTNLEALPFAFVGRSVELADLRRKLLDRHEKIVTVTGMGGIGKSTVARQVAFECLKFFPDGVWFVECDGLSTATEIQASTARVIGLETSGELVSHLAGKRALIVLDCFEQLLSTAPMLAEWASKAPLSRILVTSRSLLGIPAEFEYPLGPMIKGQRVLGDALALFADAVSHVVDGFEITPSNRKTVREICEILEGVPLAIVLAAARLRTMTLTELRDTLKGRRLALLKRRSHGNDRHADLQVVIAESFGLLESGDADLLKRLSLFVGGFFRDDASAVLPDADLVEGLDRLRENSLVSAQQVGDRMRFRLLDTIREFVDSLDGKPPIRDIERFCGHYLQSANRVASLQREGQWTAASALLWRELPNIRLAWRKADDISAIGFATDLCRTLFELGMWDAFEELYDRTINGARQANPQALIMLLGLKGAQHRRQGEEDLAKIVWTDRLAVSLENHEQRGHIDTLVDLAQQAMELSNFDEARPLAVRALHDARKASIVAYEIAAKTILAQWAHATARPATEVLRRLSEVEVMLKEVGDVDAACFAMTEVADVYDTIGSRDKARALVLDALQKSVNAQRVVGSGWILLRVCSLYLDSIECRIAQEALRRLPLDRASNLKRKIAAELDGIAPLDVGEGSWAEIAERLTKT